MVFIRARNEPSAANSCLPEGFHACPVDIAFELLGRKWAALIIRNLLRGDRHFNQILGNIDGLTPKILSTRLREMEADDVVVKQVRKGHPVQVEYRLTDKGYGLLPVLRQMVRWSLTYAPERVLGSAIRRPQELERFVEAWQSVILAPEEGFVVERQVDVVHVRPAKK